MDVAAKLPGRSVYNKKAKPSAVQCCFAPGTWSLLSRPQLVTVHFFSAQYSTMPDCDDLQSKGQCVQKA